MAVAATIIIHMYICEVQNELYIPTGILCCACEGGLDRLPAITSVSLGFLHDSSATCLSLNETMVGCCGSFMGIVFEWTTVDLQGKTTIKIQTVSHSN